MIDQPYFTPDVQGPLDAGQTVTLNGSDGSPAFKLTKHPVRYVVSDAKNGANGEYATAAAAYEAGIVPRPAAK